MYRVFLIVALALFININSANMSTAFAAEKTKDKPKVEKIKEEKVNEEKEQTPEELESYQEKCSFVSPLDLVDDPDKYLDKYVSIQAEFDRYSTLGLDYKPAFRDSKDYITFLVRRPDVKRKKHVIPLSQLKLIIKRITAEKYTNLDSGDEIKIYGKVFSNALGDPWMEVNHVTCKSKDLTAKPEKE